MNSTFDELLDLLDIPHTKGSGWYEDKKLKVEQLLERQQLLQQTDVMFWVACSESLPDSIGSYLCFWENCYVGMLFFNSKKEWCEMWQQEKHKPTHWMPLPKPPCL